MNKNCLPHFIIIGAPKCGTTALWHFLNQHENVCMSKNKEPKFFTAIKGSMEKKITGDGPRTSGNNNKGYTWYSSLFEDCKPGQLTGEASTVYFANEDAADLIYKHNKDIKLILMLRHPVKRLYSHYWQEHKLGFDFPSFTEMYKEGHPRYRYYNRISHYKQNLTRYFNYFNKDQIKIIIQEEFHTDPQKHMNEVYDYLNLNSAIINTNERVNEQVTPKNKNVAFVLMYLKSLKLSRFLPKSIDNRLKKTGIKLIKKNVKPFSYESISDELYNTLSKEFLPDIDFVESVLGRRINFWH